jgi:putative peptidoglycan lipid II flippase
METTENYEHKQKRRSLSAVIVMACTLGSRILGFVKVAVINAVFGAAGQADVLNAVFSIPNNLRKLMAEGALSSAFIPEFNRKLAQKDRDGARMLARRIMGFQYLVLVPLIIAAVLLGPQAVKIFLRFPSAAEMALAGELFRYFIPYLLLVSISAVLMAVLNSHGRFFIAALSPLLFSVAMIGAILLTSEYLGVYSMALGVLGGGIMQIIVQYFPFRSEGYRFLPSFRFNDPAFKTVLRHWLPVVLTSSIFAVNQQVAVFLGSTLESGSSSALANAIVFFQLPYGIFSASVNTVYFPQMSRRAGRGDYEGLNESFGSGLKMLLFFLVPSALMLTLLGKEIISVAFMRGAFLPENAAMAARVLTGFCSGMFFVAAYNFIQRYYYSRGSFHMPFISAALACALDIGLSLWLIHTPLRVAGLAYANSLAFFLSFAILSVAARFKYGSIGLRRLVMPAIKVGLACVLTVGFYCVLKHFIGFDWWREASGLRTLGLLVLTGGGLAVTVLLSYYILKVDFLEGIRLRRRKN